jgi:hypothetical protein
MGKSIVWAGQALGLYFQGAPVSSVADNAGASPLTSAQVSLHTGDPGTGGSQLTNEVAYTGYARAAVPRSALGWTLTGNQIANVADIAFPGATDDADSAIATYWGVGDAAAGAGVLRYSGALSTLLGSGVAIALTDVVQFGAGALAGLAVGNRIVYLASPSGVVPGGIAVGSIYYVASLPTADSMTLSATSGGATLDVTSDGSGAWGRISPLFITQNVQPILGAGALVISEY